MKKESNIEMKKLLIKVCGMKFTQNREAVEALGIDLLGFIFYAPSKRYVGDNPESDLFQSNKKNVGVFVDENAFKILQLAKKFRLGFIQLHGNENPKTCQLLKNQGLKIIKAFPIVENFDFEKTIPYEGVVDYVLFDTKTKQHGGSGKKFNWEILEKYKGITPFFLSGGIGPNDVKSILEIKHPKLAGVDLNSGFEDEPGLKNLEKLKEFIKELKK